jgi:hypothetical protein
MKEEPTEIFEDPVFRYFPEPVEKAPAGWYCWEREYSDEGSIRYVAPYRPGEKCYVREQYANLKALREQAKRLIEQWPYGSYEMPSNIDDGPDVIYKSDWDAQGKKFVGKWIFTTAESARRFVTVLSCTPMRVDEVTEEDAIKLSFTFDEHNQVMARESFENDWHKRHPDKEWAWRIESEGNQG